MMILTLWSVGIAHAQSTTRHTKKPVKRHSVPANHPKGVPPSPASEAGERQLTQLARALRDDGNATTYAALSAFAVQNAKKEVGAHAALALGYYDLSRDKPDAAMAWLRKANDDKVLRQYVQFWQAETLLALGQKDEALAQLQSFRRDFPNSVMTELVLSSLAQTAIAVGKNEEALAALDAYSNTVNKPALLLLRAQAREKLSAAKGEKPVSAAEDYLDVYYRFPLNDEARAAGLRIPSLQSTLGELFPGTPTKTQIARAETFFAAKRWRDARNEFAALLPTMAGVDRERATLRIAQCDVQSGGKPELLTELTLTDPELDAERLYSVSQVHRSHKLETQMLEDVEQMAKRFPQSSWLEEGLFAAGNFYWVNLDRDRASDLYRRSLDVNPYGKNSQVAAWRVAWTAYLDRKPEAADLIESYVRQYPTSSYIQDALYWLGRSYERSGNPAHARSFYLAAANRFPLTYFGAKAAERIRVEPEGIGTSPLNPADFLSVIPPAPALPVMDLAQTAQSAEREGRARALTAIAFDASAELEYRAAFAATKSPQFLIDVADAAIAAGHYAAGMVAVRQAFPQLEARHVMDIPSEAWHAAFPLPYETTLRSAAAHNQLDPMLIAGLIRQESAFESEALSRVGAVGLMQMMPKTAVKLARQLKVRYARSRLTDPGYNLQLGSRYLADLIQAHGTPEAALAAYNAGEDRVAQWTAGQNYLETAEFVESIPFTETREYVQIVIRNADVYRQIYGPPPAQEAALTRVPATVPVKTKDTRSSSSSTSSSPSRGPLEQ